MKKEQKVLVAQALSIGWTFEGLTRNSHMRFRGPNGEVHHASGTPSDHRSVKNTLAQMKRASRAKEMSNGS